MKHVKEIKGHYYFVPYIPVKDRDRIECDKYGYAASIPLGAVDTPDHKILAAYAAAKKQIEHQKEPNLLTLYWLSGKYQSSQSYKALAPDTQKAYATKDSRILDHLIVIDSKPAALGTLDARDLDTVTIRNILDQRLDKYQQNGQSGASQCNHQRNYLSNLYKYGMEYIPELAQIIKNPVTATTKFKTAKRDRHVSDAEYQAQYNVALENPENGLHIVFELTLGLAARGIEVLTLKASDCTEEGIYVNRRKGSLANIIKWTADDAPKENSRLWKAYKAAMDRHTEHKILPIDPPLLITRTGSNLTAGGLQSAMGRLKKKMKERGMLEIYWTVHELKHKAMTEAEDKRMGGHKSEEMRQLYDHSVETFKPGI